MPIENSTLVSTKEAGRMEYKAPLHDEKYGSHKFEPSPYKTVKEWRQGHADV